MTHNGTGHVALYEALGIDRNAAYGINALKTSAFSDVTNKKEPLADKYLEELARSENYTFKRYAARSSKASPDILEHVFVVVFHTSAGRSLNPATPVEILRVGGLSGSDRSSGGSP